MAVFYTYEKNLEEEKMDFLRTLYHDKRGGQMIRLRKKGDQVSQLSTCDMDELAATGTDLIDTYTTVHTFRGYKRTSDRIFNFGSIFIDLDCHADDPDQIQTAKMRTVEILEDAFSDGRLAVPTMITDSGRGFGLQYVLDKSIANTWKTEKIRAFYKKVRKKLYVKYLEILSADPQAAQPDASVLDDARVCRIPGTYNVAADNMCRLIAVSGKCYELLDLVQGCNLWDWKSEEEYKKAKEEKERKKKKLASRPVVPFAEYRLPFLSTRLEQLEKLQEMRGADCEGCREQMLFIAYSALVQIDRSTAAVRLQVINKQFTDPLPQAELDHIIQETDQSVGIDHKGYYKLSNVYVVDMLALTEEEIKALGIGQGLKRAADRKAARDKKKETRKKVVELLMQADSLTYEKIAEAAGVSRRTVCTIAKAEGLMRYAKAAERKNNAETTSKVIVIDSVREGENQVAESANFATGSVCAPSIAPTGTHISTPAVRGTGGEAFDWFNWLDARASSDAVAREILDIFSWSFCKWSSTSLSYDIEEYLDRTMIKVMSHPERLTSIRDTVARILFKHYGIDECAFLFGMHKIADVLPTVWGLYVTAGQKENEKKRKATQRRAERQQKKYSVDVATETPQQREARINRHLKNYSDKRFDIIETSDEYQRRLEPDVIRMVKTACMQVGRLKRDFFWIENQKVQTSDIKQCFKSLTYKDIAVICERMAHQGTIQEATTPFYYVLQTVWKYRHPEAAEAQADRIKEEKSANRFNNFESHTYDFDFWKFMEINAMREIIRQPPLSKEEYMDSLKLIDK
jgi:hypothetical protein